MCSISLSVSSHSSLLVFIQTMEEKTCDCCRMAKSSFLPRRNNGYFGQKVTKTLFGNSPNINGSASAVLQKLLIEQTKSRSGRCNDNALIESKNGSVIRKHMGHRCIFVAFEGFPHRKENSKAKQQRRLPHTFRGPLS